jgi:exosortase A
MPMRLEPQSTVPEVAALAEARALRAFAAIAAILAVVAAVYWQTSASMASIWLRSETFTHAFLVVPAVLWFVWTERRRLAATASRAWWPGVFALAAAGFGWLVGELASALAPTQWAMVLMVPALVATVFGTEWLRVLAFPLAFLCFAVPFGEAFVPTLIDWTADFTVAAVSASGVPVYREGNQFVIPSGRWSVVEACSGIRYLIASVVVGTLYAWMMYRSPLRRAAFIGAAVAVPLAANWVRAYLIVMTGHLSDNRIAAGVDHLIYGWLFFGVVILAMFWIGARWRQDGAASTPSSDPVSSVDAAVLRAPLLPSAGVLVAAGLMIASWPLARDALLAAGDKRPIAAAPIAPAAGWTVAAAPASAWNPALEAPAQLQVASFARDGQTVTVHVGWYRDQRQGSELVNSMNRILQERTAGWEQIAGGATAADFGGGPALVRTASLRGEGRRVRVWQWYWIDGRLETRDVLAKMALALDRLLVRSDTSAWVAVSTAADSDAAADRVLATFVREHGNALQEALATTAAR